MKPYRAPKWLIITLLGVVFGLLASGFVYFRMQQRALREEAEKDLLAVAQVKLEQIAAWRENQLAEGRELMSSSFLMRGINDWIRTRDEASEDLIRGRMQSLVDHYHYRDILMLTPDSRQLMSFSGERVPLHPEMEHTLEQARESMQPILSDIHQGEHFEYPHITLTVPLALTDQNQIRLLGYFLFVIDANDFLYPLIQSWPQPSQTAETLLIRQDGNDALFLNELRHTKGTALSLRIPLDQLDVPAVKAIHGESGIVDGLDYRGVDVITAIQPVPDTSWFMVAKVDKAEALAVWRNYASLIVMMILGLAGSAGGLGMTIWQRDAKRHYARIADVERDKFESEERHRVTLMSVGDAVIVTDKNGIIQLMNPVAEQLTGWKLDEARGKHLEEVFHIINEGTRQRVEDPVSKVMREGKVVGLANHTLLVSRDGREYPIADSGAPVRIEQDDISGVVLVFRDQSEEHAALHRLEESEQKFITYFESSPTAISITSPDGLYLGVNRAYCDLTGYKENEVVGKPATDFTFKEDRKAFKGRMSDSLAGGQESHRIEKRLVAKSGEAIWVSGNTNLITDSAGKPLFFLSHMMDISRQKETEEELRRSEERFRLLAEHAPEGIFVQSGMKFAYVNPAAVKLFGAADEEELLNSSMIERFTPDAHESIRRRIEEIMKEKIQAGSMERRCVRMDGSEFDAEVAAAYFAWQNKEGTLVFIRDITERKQAITQLEERETLLNQIFDVLPIGLWLTDKDGKLTRSNQAGREIWGAEPLVGQEEYGVFKARRISTGEEISADDWALSHTINEKTTTRAEMLEIEAFDGAKKIILNYTAPVLDKNGDILAAIILNLDITEKQKAEDRLKRSEELLKRAQEIAHVGSWVWYIQDNKLEWSDEMFRIFGIEKDGFDGDLGSVIARAIHPDDRAAVEASNSSVINDKKPVPLEYRIIRPDSSIRTVWAEAGDLILDKKGNAIRLEGIVQDITEYKQIQQEIQALNQNLEKRVEERTKELKEAQEKLLRQERLAVLGQLAGSVSHELRNPLGVISNSIYILNTLMKDADDKAKEYLQMINDETRRSEKIIKDMLDFSRVRMPDSREFDLEQISREALNRVKPTAGIDVAFNFENNLPPAFADPIQITQVIENLLSNAVQAMPDGGQLSISGCLEREKKGGHLQIDIKDTGKGMTDEVLDKIYEPLFTTKTRGIGLGLPLSKSLIEANRGTISVKSHPGEGSTFSITVPIRQSEEK